MKYPVFVQSIDDNIGDFYACPQTYFPEFLTCWKVDWRAWDGSGELVIFGGGGLIHPEIEVVFAKAKGRSILWGVGHNHHGESRAVWPTYMSKFDLIGLRDANSPWNYVPCVSCLHNMFSYEYQITRDFVVYEHRDIPIPLTSFEKMRNCGTRNDFFKIVPFLGSADCVITNSYHGAYWAMLLGRKCIVFEPWSTKFYGFKNPVWFADATNWQTQARLARPNDWYLQDCRDQNMHFYDKVKGMLEV